MPLPPLNWESLPPTPQQSIAIARLCIILGIKPELESVPITRREARDLLYRLKNELRERHARHYLKMYHVTPWENWLVIKKEGLYPAPLDVAEVVGFEEGIYLATSREFYDEATMDIFAHYMHPGMGAFAILEIEIPSNVTLVPDPYEAPDVYIVKEPIPPENIRLMEKYTV